jgi:type II secretory pathway component HofQ
MWAIEQQAAVVDYALNRISRDDVLRTLSLELEQAPDEVRQQLQLAIMSKTAHW